MIRRLFFLIACIGIFSCSQHLFAQIDGGGEEFNFEDLDGLGDFNFLQGEALSEYRFCGPCLLYPGGLLVNPSVSTGTVTFKMPGMSWVGVERHGDSCEVEVSFTVHECYYGSVGAIRTLVVQGIFIKPCCNIEACVRTTPLFLVKEAWSSALIRKLVEANAGNIIVDASLGSGSFSIITQTCYRGQTRNSSGLLNLGADIVFCGMPPMQCCVSNFSVVRDQTTPCAYSVIGRRIPADCISPTDFFWCTHQCYREMIEGLDTGIYVIVN